MSLINKYKQIKEILTWKVLPSHDVVMEITDQVSTILEDEINEYRPCATNGVAGSLLDFSSSELPVIIIPDIHARPYFLMNILDFKLSELGNVSVFEALYTDKVRLVCVGDILHSERHTKERWLAALQETNSGVFTGPALSAEMLDGLSVLCGYLTLKSFFPQNVHLLKGNHENVYNYTGNGDYSFRKYADEGQMVKNFIQSYYGEDVLYMIHCVERILPLVFVGKKCIISHSEPAQAYTRQQIIDARMCSTVIEGLTWTDNDESEENSVIGIIEQLNPDSDVLYFGGHRPVINNYELRQNGKFIQIHNPSKQNISYVNNKKVFNPETDIYEVSK